MTKITQFVPDKILCLQNEMDEVKICDKKFFETFRVGKGLQKAIVQGILQMVKVPARNLAKVRMWREK